MNNVAKALTVAALAVGVSAPAFAQYNNQQGFSLKAGFFRPVTSQVRNVAGDDWFGFGAEYELGDLGVERRVGDSATTFHLSLDWYGDGDFSSVPLLINYRGKQDKIYWTAGAGVGIVRTPNLTGGTRTNEEFCYAFSIGYDFSYSQTPIFVEARFMGSVEDNLNGFGIYGGVRF